MTELKEKIEQEEISLLFPEGRGGEPGKRGTIVNSQAEKDLNLAKMIISFCPGQMVNRDKRVLVERLRANILTLLEDPAVISYRQDVLEDLINNPTLVETIKEIMPELLTLSELNSQKYDRGGGELLQVVDRLRELESFVKAVNSLNGVMKKVDNLCSEGLKRLKEYLKEVTEEPVFSQLNANLPELLSKINGISSITIGVNLDSRFRPKEAVLVSINRDNYSDSPILTRLLGRGQGKWHGMTKMHSSTETIVKVNAMGLDMGREEQADPTMLPLFKDLSGIMSKTSKEINSELKRYLALNRNVLVRLNSEIMFFLGAVELALTLKQAGLPICRPVIAPKREKIFEVEGNYNLDLACDIISERADTASKVVTNSVKIDEEGRIIILTGPNRGGKTMFIQAVALTQLLAQAGLFVPARSARISPVDSIFTHYQIEERPGNHTGRLGDEAKRFYEIFEKVSEYSLVISNESLCSTNAGESLYIAEDLIAILRQIGARAIFATHLHELAKNADKINKKYNGSGKVISMVSQVKDGVNTFKIIKSPPMGHSYAQKIAEKYGIGYGQLEKMIKERGLL